MYNDDDGIIYRIVSYMIAHYIMLGDSYCIYFLFLYCLSVLDVFASVKRTTQANARTVFDHMVSSIMALTISLSLSSSALTAEAYEQRASLITSSITESCDLLTVQLMLPSRWLTGCTGRSITVFTTLLSLSISALTATG